ncbi:MAG: hypothetical protein ACR2MM_02870 [Flavobacteriaceae bacterium]
MNGSRTFIVLVLQFVIAHFALAQTNGNADLFQDKEPISLKVKYSTKILKRDTNDSTYMSTVLYMENKLGQWDSLPVELRTRGNYRREYCYYTPLKLKMNEKYTNGNVFYGHKKLKWVLPCLMGENSDDFVIKEYLAYRLYETISNYHFRVKLTELEFQELKGRRTKIHHLMAFFIEDIDKASERYKGHEVVRDINPINQDAYQAIKLALFQFMIGNTDFSIKRRHNVKLIYTEDKIISLPYDFDMAGLVDTHYAIVSNIQNIPARITDVKERAYKGYPRDPELMNQLRQEFLENKTEILNVVSETRKYFQDPVQFRAALQYIESFFKIVENDKRYHRFITNKIRGND